MRVCALLGVSALLAMSVAWAAAPAAAPHRLDPASATRAPASRVSPGAQLRQRQDEARRLKQAVATQEAQSEQARARLQEQDRVINELQRQLQPAPRSTPTGQH